MRFSVDTRMLETFKMRMRFLYAIFIWYEFILHPEQLDMPLAVLGDRQYNMNLVPLWAASIIMYIIEFTEIMCG